MSKLILTIALVTFIAIPVKPQWEILNQGLGNGSLQSIDFISNNAGWIAGFNGTMLKTTNGGEKWLVVELDEKWQIDQIDFINEDIGWAIGMCDQQTSSIATIYKTNDSGSTWVIQKQISNTRLNSLFAVNENHAFVVGDGGKILITYDGGLNWLITQVNSNFDLLSIWIFNEECGFVTGKFGSIPNSQGILLKTTNNGNSWDEYFLEQFGAIDNLYFINDSIGFFQDGSNWLGLYKTNDKLQSWTQIYEGFPTTSFVVKDENSIYLSAMNYYDQMNCILETTNSGIFWDTLATFDLYGGVPWFNLNSIYFIEPINFFLAGGFCGNYPVILSSNDGGNSWKMNNLKYPVKQINFLDRDRGYLVGGGYIHMFYDNAGNIFSTNDAGEIWYGYRFLANSIAKKMIFIDSSLGFLLADNKIEKTVDGGSNWEQVYFNDFVNNGFQLYGNDICFSNEDIGWVVGWYVNEMTDTAGAGIMSSTDGGDNWDLVWKYLDPEPFINTYNLFSIDFTESFGCAVGDAGMIVKYTKADGWMLEPFLTDLPLIKIFFYDDSNGWIAGGYINSNGFQKIFLKTTNAGETWDINQSIPYLVNDIIFLDADHGWAVGNDENNKGVILYTENGGTQWYIQVGNLEEPMVSLCFFEEYGWAVGSSGMILSTTDNGVVWVDQNNNNTYPTEFYLSHNYPNPFNPGTTIQYQIPRRSLVTLKIYDVLGNEIETLVNKEQPQGVYEIDYDGIRLSSGVYLYKLQTDSYAETRKMILLK